MTLGGCCWFQSPGSSKVQYSVSKKNLHNKTVASTTRLPHYTLPCPIFTWSKRMRSALLGWAPGQPRLTLPHTHLPFGNTTAPPSQWSVLSNYSTDHPRFGLPFQSEPEMANERNGKNTKEEAEKEAEKGGLHTVQSWPTQDGLFHGTRETPRNPL